MFYPKGLRQARELEYASRQFNSIEINASFYRLQTAGSYQTWYAQTPTEFLFAVKGGRFITHMKKLREVEQPLANFFASGVLLLKEKLGPILWQFPPNLGFDEQRFDAFFQLLPKDTRQAALLARHHNQKVTEPITQTDTQRPLRYAVEIRHDTYLTPAFVRLLRKYNIALVFADTAGLFPYTEDVTADFIYIRLHGAEQIYWSGYSDAMLDWWAARIHAWAHGSQPPNAKTVAESLDDRRPRDIYVYFDNDANVRAPFDAMTLAQKVRK
ncbi:MAG: DUF72 domain-containing protein [Bacillota bacterium]